MPETAVITGASSGIGWELAREFAVHKINLVLVARNEAKLKELAVTLQQSFGITVHYLAKDLSLHEAPQEVWDYCNQHQLTIDYLVNNAGVGHFGMFADADWERQQQMINLNITALTRLTHLFLPGMIKRKQGRILNVASTAAFQPGPMMAVYFASKAFVLHFSEAIANELSGKGVTVTALCPGPTESNFKDAAQMQEARLFKDKRLPSSRAVAAYGFRALVQGRAVAIHGTRNYLLANSVRMVPRSVIVKIARFLTE